MAKTQHLSRQFFSATPVFRREEYARALNKSVRDPNVTAMLTYHRRAGNVQRVARGVYASVPAHVSASTWVVDQLLAASRLRREAVVAYHSALELHGFAYSTFSEVQLMAPGEPGRLKARGFTCRFLPVRAGLNRATDVMSVDRLGLQVAVTTPERTIADLFDRYDLAGDVEELLQSLNLVSRVKTDRLYDCVRSLDNASAAASVGWWLEMHRDRLKVSASDLVKFRGLAPTHAQYVLGAKPGSAKLAPNWNIMAPVELLTPRFENA